MRCLEGWIAECGGCETGFARSSVHVRSTGDLGSWKGDICSTSCQATSATLIVPPTPFLQKTVCMWSRRVSYLAEIHPPSLHLCLSCVENSKAWGSYNGGLLTGLAGYPHCFRKDTKCPPLGVQWRSVEGILYKEQDVSTTEPYFFGNAKSSQTVLCHEFKTDPMNLFGKICAFTDALPNSINVCIAPQDVIEVRVKPAAAFMLMNSLVRTFWAKLNYSSSWQETSITYWGSPGAPRHHEQHRKSALKNCHCTRR